MFKNFLVDPVSGTINIHYDGLNPRQVHDLIQMLQSNVRTLEMMPAKPLDVMQKTSRINRILGEISFALGWREPTLRAKIGDPAPEPNVVLTIEEYEEYLDLFTMMTQE